LLKAQKDKGTSIGVVAPKEIKKVEVVQRSENEQKSFEQKLANVKKIQAASTKSSSSASGSARLMYPYRSAVSPSKSFDP
jgi:hypothetical protein